MKSPITLLLATLSFLPASAAVLTGFSGDTTGGPLWNRPASNFSGLSGSATEVPYLSVPFTVTISGGYNFTAVSWGYDGGTGDGEPIEGEPIEGEPIGGEPGLEGRGERGWDNYSFIYENAFDPSNPLLNGLIGNDDYAHIGITGFDVTLDAGVNYFYVMTGYFNDDFGGFDLTVAGPGSFVTDSLSAVPEPGSALGLAGLLSAGLLLRRRPSCR